MSKNAQTFMIPTLRERIKVPPRVVFSNIVPISCTTVLYESYSTVMWLIGQIQYSYAGQLCKECYENSSTIDHVHDIVNR